MACPAGTTIQYNLDLFTDPREGQMRPESHFTFCLIINGNTVTGVVDELGVPVTGTNFVLGKSGLHRITLNFFWSPSVISLQGFTFPESGRRREFLARFVAFEPDTDFSGGDDKDVRVLVGPDPGETGTGTGNNT